jgi:uncharacterized membrane protein
MSVSTEEMQNSNSAPIQKLPLAAALVALIGLIDSIYLTVSHYQKTVVPCSIVSGCETVLTSQYAEIAGVPLALFGALAYFAVFSLATLAAFGSENSWRMLSVAVALMAIFTAWLLYLQAFVIGAFCQFCLLSAATTFTLLLLVAARYFASRRTVKLQ